MKDTVINDFREALSAIDISWLPNANLSTDPNTVYEQFEKIITEMYDKYFPEKCVRFNKYKHKLSNWVTSGILKSIEFRDKLYQRLKTENSEYERLKQNLKLYNGYLNRCIRTAKKQFYHNEFSKYKNDVRNTWDTLKESINKKSFKSDVPPSFVHDGVEITGAKTIADKFNEYFTEIGPKLARAIDAANKNIFNSYLTAPCATLFNFDYTNPDDIGIFFELPGPNRAQVMTIFLQNCQRNWTCHIASIDHYNQPITMYRYIPRQEWDCESDTLVQERR